jgi:hypothetical protein
MQPGFRLHIVIQDFINILFERTVAINQNSLVTYVDNFDPISAFSCLVAVGGEKVKAIIKRKELKRN